MKFVPITTLLALMTCTSMPAFAEKDRGGGDVYECGDVAYLADTYPLRQDPVLLRRIKPVNSFLSLIIGDGEPFAWNNRDQAVKSLRFFIPNNGDQAEINRKHLFVANRVADITYVAVKERLPDLADDNIPDASIPNHCTKEQLAIQDLTKNEVRYNERLYKKLIKSDKLFFPTHEAFINLREVFGISTGADTTLVRDANLSYAFWLLGRGESRSIARTGISEDVARQILKKVRNVEIVPVNHPDPLPKHAVRGDESVSYALRLADTTQSGIYHHELQGELEKLGVFLPGRSSHGCPLTDSFRDIRSSKGYLIRQPDPCLKLNDLLCLMTDNRADLNCDPARYRSVEPMIPIELAKALSRKSGLPD